MKNEGLSEGEDAGTDENATPGCADSPARMKTLARMKTEWLSDSVMLQSRMKTLARMKTEWLSDSAMLQSGPPHR